MFRKKSKLQILTEKLENETVDYKREQFRQKIQYLTRGSVFHDSNEKGTYRKDVK